MRHNFVDERVLITTTFISSCHWKTLAPFYLSKKRTENAFWPLILNYCKIVQKNKLCYWLFKDIWCYLFISCFDWKVGVSRKTVVMVYYIRKSFASWCCASGVSYTDEKNQALKFLAVTDAVDWVLCLDLWSRKYASFIVIVISNAISVAEMRI